MSDTPEDKEDLFNTLPSSESDRKFSGQESSEMLLEEENVALPEDSIEHTELDETEGLLSEDETDVDDADADVLAAIPPPETITEEPLSKDGKSDRSALLLPLIVLLAAVGAGAFLFGGLGNSGPGSSHTESPMSAQEENYMQSISSPVEVAGLSEDEGLEDEGIPLPAPVENEIPRPPEAVGIETSFSQEENPFPEFPEESFPDITEPIDPVETLNPVTDPFEKITRSDVQAEPALSPSHSEDSQTENKNLEISEAEKPRESNVIDMEPQTDDTGNQEEGSLEEPHNLISSVSPQASELDAPDYEETQPLEPLVKVESQEESFETNSQNDLLNAPDMEDSKVPESQPDPSGTDFEVPSEPVPLPNPGDVVSSASPAPSPVPKINPDAYYDAGLNVPTTNLGTNSGPRKLDPSQEPASRFVVVEKAHSASDIESLLVSANRALKLRRYDSAVDLFDRLYEKNKRDPRILMGRAVALQNAGRTESALQNYEALLEIDPNNANAMVNMLGLLKSQYPETALRRLLDLQNRFPRHPGLAAQIGVTQGELGHYEDAVRYLGMAASLEPRNPQHLFNLAIVAEKKGDVDSAIRYYEQALESDAINTGGKTLPRETIYDRLAVLRRR